MGNTDMENTVSDVKYYQIIYRLYAQWCYRISENLPFHFTECRPNVSNWQNLTDCNCGDHTECIE